MLTRLALQNNAYHTFETIEIELKLTYLNGIFFFFLPGFAQVFLKRSCVSFFCAGANVSFFSKSLMLTSLLITLQLVSTCISSESIWSSVC